MAHLNTVDDQDPLQVRAGVFQSGPDGRGDLVFSGDQDHGRRGLARCLSSGKRSAAAGAGCQIQAQERLAQPGLAAEQGELAQWNATRPQPLHGPGRHITQPHRPQPAHLSACGGAEPCLRIIENARSQSIEFVHSFFPARIGNPARRSPVEQGRQSFTTKTRRHQERQEKESADFADLKFKKSASICEICG